MEFANLFQQRYPDVILKPERLITDEGGLYCFKAMIHDMGRTSQAPYSVFQFQRKHQDKRVREVQRWIKNHYSEEW